MFRVAGVVPVGIHLGAVQSAQRYIAVWALLRCEHVLLVVLPALPASTLAVKPAGGRACTQLPSLGSAIVFIISQMGQVCAVIRCNGDRVSLLLHETSRQHIGKLDDAHQLAGERELCEFEKVDNADADNLPEQPEPRVLSRPRASHI